jgi:hypothetical protein
LRGPAAPSADPATTTGIVTVSNGPPAGERVQWVNSPSFNLEYDTDSIGPEGIRRVELWGTRDGGRTWRSFVVAENPRGPLRVNLQEEGIYGFRVALQTNNGRANRPPKSGDLPEKWVGVDLTKPAGRITRADVGTGEDTNKLTIAWEARDNQKLAPRPISLSFSETLGGPWTPIASGLEDTGRYTWLVDAQTPQRVYLRLEVRDEAGNIGTYETPSPVSLEQSAPTVRIRGVRPLDPAGAQGPQRSYLR